MAVVKFIRIFMVTLLSVFTLVVNAQQSRFVYVQTEDGQPFYVKLNNKVISSSAAGYIILPNMVDGDYRLVIGFPKNEFPEETFGIAVDKKNMGFLLKDFGEKGKSLFNLQTLALIPGTSANSLAAASPEKNSPNDASPKNDTSANNEKSSVANAPPAVEKMSDDPFSTMLARVVKDSSILRKNEPVVTREVASPKNETATVVPDAPAQKANEIVPEVNQSQNSVNTSSITKLMGTNDYDGMQMVYVDKAANDTVRVFIPADKNQPAAEEKPVHLLPDSSEQYASNQRKDSEVAAHEDSFQLTITPTIINPADVTPSEKEDTVTLINDTIRVYKEDKSAETSASTDSSIKVEPQSSTGNDVVTAEKPATKNTQSANRDQIVVLPKVVTSSTVNSDCKSFASNEDFLRLRKKMAAENNNDDMISAAKKVLRTKCFSTEQIRNLSYLFLTDEGKYMFFDAAYPFASDSDQYGILESQLKDEYYINRFHAMIHVK